MKKNILINVLIFLFAKQSVLAFFPIPSMDINFNTVPEKSDLAALIKKYKPDITRENRIITQIEDSVVEGDVEWLKTNGRQIFSIYTESESEKAKGGVIILHSRGQHANWQSVVKPLRVGLAEQSWHTLSVQMPVLGKKAKYYDYVLILPYARTRIQAAIDFYKQKGIKNIVLVAHACGAHMARDFLDRYGTQDLSAFIGIGMGATDYKQKVFHPMILTLLDKKIPILDVIAQHDFLGVLRFANIRKEAFKVMNNPKNKQVIVPNAGHYYQEEKTTTAMVNSIASWLDGL